MTDKKITDFDAINTAENTDVLLIADVSDTSVSIDGTYKKINRGDFLKIGSQIQAFSTILQNTTASFTTADKAKLDSINVNGFTNIAVSGQSNVVADTPSDTLTLVAGSNIILTTNATNDSITITSIGGSGGGGGGSGDLLSINNLSDLNDISIARTNLGLEIGADVQAYSAILGATTASFTTADKAKLDFISVTQAIDLDNIDLGYLPTPNLLEYSSSVYFYYGWEDVNGGWLIRRQNRTTLSELSAFQTNNPSYTDLTTAWTNKESLIYG